MSSTDVDATDDAEAVEGVGETTRKKVIVDIYYLDLKVTYVNIVNLNVTPQNWGVR